MLPGISRRRRILYAALVVAAGLWPAVRLSGQQTAAPPTPTPTVGVDFLALGSDGRPAMDVKAEELSLRIDGRARAIRSLDIVRVPNARMGASAERPAALPSPFGTNNLADIGRTVLLVFDEDSLQVARSRPTQDAAAAFLAGLAPQDRVALITVPHGGMVVDLTTDHARVLKALNDVAANAKSGETLNDAACRTLATLQSLTGLLESLGGGSGPTTMIFFTATLTGPVGMISPGRTPTTGSSLAPVAAVGRCDLQPAEFQHVGDAAARARTYIYIARTDDSVSTANPSGSVSTRSVAGNLRGNDSLTAGLADLAGVTGGEQFPLIPGASGGDNALIRIALESTAYYVVTFEPDPADRNGTLHKVELKSSRGNDTVSIRTLPSVFIPSADTHGAATAPPTPTTPGDMLKESKAYRDLPLRASGYVGRNSGDGRLKIVGLFECPDDLAKITSAMAGLYDSTGRMVYQWTARSGDLNRSPMASALLLPQGVDHGTFRMRVAATDTSGRSGTADFPIDAHLASAGPIKLSDIVLGVSTREGFQPRLQFTDQQPVASAYLEIYNGKPDLPILVFFELARTANGPGLMPPARASIEPTSDADRFLVTAALPIANLDAGDYAVRATVYVDKQTTSQVRTLRKVQR
jgi:VWFA-related protein